MKEVAALLVIACYWMVSFAFVLSIVVVACWLLLGVVVLAVVVVLARITK